MAGAVLATTGLAALVFALTFAGARGPAAAATLAAVGAAVVLGAALARVEARAADPLFGRALRRPGVAGPNVVALVLTAATTPPMLLCTLYAQDVLGLAPAAAGLLFPPFNLAVVAGSLAGPRIAGAVGDRRAMAGGLLGVAAGALALFAIGPGTPRAALAGGRLRPAGRRPRRRVGRLDRGGHGGARGRRSGPRLGPARHERPGRDRTRSGRRGAARGGADRGAGRRRRGPGRRLRAGLRAAAGLALAAAVAVALGARRRAPRCEAAAVR